MNDIKNRITMWLYKNSGCLFINIAGSGIALRHVIAMSLGSIFNFFRHNFPFFQFEKQMFKAVQKLNVYSM